MAWKKLYIKPNKAAQKAAKRGLEARKRAPKSKKGGLDAMQAAELGIGSGVLRARDIVAGKRVNAYQVNGFFNRHRNNYINAKLKGLKPEESKAIQAWLLWGGEPLRKQAEAAVRKDKARRNPIFDVPDNVLDPVKYTAARGRVKDRVDVWPSAYASGQLVQEYKRMGGRYANPTARIDRSGKITYGEYFGLPDGEGGYDLYYEDELIASGVETVEEAESEIRLHQANINPHMRRRRRGIYQ